MNCLHLSDGGYREALVDRWIISRTLGTYYDAVNLAATCTPRRQNWSPPS